MVELGKRDALDRNNLPMALFDRNSSLKAVCLSPEKASDPLVLDSCPNCLGSLVAVLSSLTPIHRFAWTHIPTTFRFLLPGTHVGKVVLSQGGPGSAIEVPSPWSLRVFGHLPSHKSKYAIKQINALGTHIDLLNLHQAAESANYVAGNVFLDLFAAYHRSCGQPAYSIHLGISGDAGVIAERAKLKESVDSPMYRGLNEGQLRKILYFALLQQQKKHLAGTHDLEHSPMIIGFVAMQLDDSILKMDARFSPLFNGRDGSGEQVASSGNGGNTNTDVQALPLLLRTQFAERAAKLQAMVDVVNGFFMRVLRLSERIMDAGRPITVYGTDSLPLSRSVTG
ncbi:hypothetical protein F4801DRAFT_579005 [Xylaria longipes]|nr:hypothetical protein F4801DRAFT_579005 [Xylaria longipes]